jgi:hypothetical protein
LFILFCLYEVGLKILLQQIAFFKSMLQIFLQCSTIVGFLCTGAPTSLRMDSQSAGEYGSSYKPPQAAAAASTTSSDKARWPG